MKKLIVNTEKEVLLSKYILSKFKNLNYNSFKKALRNKDIKVSGKRTNKDIMIKNGDILEIYITDNVLSSIPSNIKYYLNDENIVIAYKWQGIMTNCELNKDKKEPTFEEVIKDDLHLNFLKACHRLDTNTSGLVILAKSENVFNEVKRAFSDFKIEKHYIAYVNNYQFQKMHEVLIAYLIKDNKTGFSKITDKNLTYSQKITTEYTVLNQNKDKNYAILDVVLHTGKTHQIRCHLASINHEIIGDSKYGKNEVNKRFKKSKQLLVAYKYKFNFDEKSILNYLNDKSIEIEKEALELL